MTDLRSKVRDAGAGVKQTLRKADGDESLGDKAANVADKVGNAVKNAGDAAHEKVDEASRDAAYDAGRIDERMRPH